MKYNVQKMEERGIFVSLDENRGILVIEGRGKFPQAVGDALQDVRDAMVREMPEMSIIDAEGLTETLATSAIELTTWNGMKKCQDVR